MDLPDLVAQLGDLEARYQTWAEPIDRVIRECMAKANQRECTPAEFKREVDAATERQRARYDPYEAIYALFDLLCPAYLEASAAEREAVRAAFVGKGGLQSALLGYAYRAAKSIGSRKDREWLRRGLAAISIENCSRDYRDVTLALAHLWAVAKAAGIRPQGEFAAVAELSSTDQPRGGSTPVQSMLAYFRG